MIYIANGNILDKQRHGPQNKILLIGHVICKKIFQMFSVDLTAQTLCHNLYYLLKRIALFLRMKHRRYNHKEIFQGNRIKIRSQIYWYTGTNWALTWRPVQTLLIDTPQKRCHQIFIDGNTILFTSSFQSLYWHISMHHSKFCRRQFFSLDMKGPFCLITLFMTLFIIFQITVLAA